MFLGYAVYAADRTVLAAMLKPLSASLGLKGSYLGLLVAAQYIGVLAFVFLSGFFADKYGPWRVVLTGVLVFTAFTWLIGLAQTFPEAFVFRLLSGCGEGIFWPAAMSAVANYFGTSKGAALGIFYAGFDIGGAAGNVIGSATFAMTSDWRTAFFVAPLLGVPVVAGLILSRGALRDASGKVGRLTLGREAVALLRERQMLALMSFALLATWASVWQVAYLPYYYGKVLGFGVSSAALVAAAVLVAGLAGKVTLGRKSDSWDRRKMLTGLSLLVAGLYAVFFSTSDLAAGLASALGMGFFSAAIFPVMQALAADSSGGKAGVALGLTTSFQSVATVFATFITASLFTLGVGKAVALDAMIPAIAMAGAGFVLRDPRTGRGTPSAGKGIQP
jgi:MFS transporter, ACS family, aldohexuronate transporter